MYSLLERLILESIYYYTELEIKKEHSKIKKAKLAALSRLRLTIQKYGSDGFIFFVIWGIAAKKAEMIFRAKTKDALCQIERPAALMKSYERPRPYQVLEEEMLLWSQESLKAPLTTDGFKRYMEIFEKFFPDESLEMWRD